MRAWTEVREQVAKAMARNRYRRAVELIRATDQHRVLSRVGGSTNTDVRQIKEALDGYRRA